MSKHSIFALYARFYHRLDLHVCCLVLEMVARVDLAMSSVVVLRCFDGVPSLTRFLAVCRVEISVEVSVHLVH